MIKENVLNCQKITFESFYFKKDCVKLKLCGEFDISRAIVTNLLLHFQTFLFSEKGTLFGV